MTEQPENPRAWMKALCRAENTLLATPFLHDHNGQTYECATNGHGLILMSGSGVTTRRDGPPLDSFLARAPVLLGHAGIDDLIAWGEAIECRCGTCDFAGVVTHRHPIKLPFRLGRLFGRQIDRWCVFTFLENLRPHSGYVEVRSKTDPLAPIQFFGDGWIVVIMPCRDYEENGLILTDYPPPNPGQRAALEVLEGGAR